MFQGLGSVGIAGPLGGVGMAAGIFSLDVLMAAQSNGFWFDFTKTDRLFQQNSGALYADDAGETIGLSLDQRSFGDKTLNQIYASQPDILGGGDGVSLEGWTVTFGTIESVGGRYRVTSVNGSNAARASKPITCEVGKTYAIKSKRFAGLAPFPIIAATVSSTAYGSAVAVSPGGGGDDYLFFVATQTTHYVMLVCSSPENGYYADFDEITVRPIPSQFASQPVAAMKPLFRAGGGAIFDAVDDSLLTAYTAGPASNFIVAKVTVPSTIGVAQVICGASNAGDGAPIRMSISPAGQLRVTAGSAVIQDGGPDLRGTTALVGMTFGSGILKGFSNSQEVSSGSYVGPITSFPYALGAANIAGSLSAFFGGTIHSIVGGREVLDAVDFNKIASKL